MMAPPRPSSFAEVLRHHRRAAGLTQEELAERAGLSRRTVSDLERGLYQHPHLDTIHLLARALELDAEEQAAFLRSARRVETAAPADQGEAHSERGEGGHRTSPLDHPSNLPDERTPFIGRAAEVAALADLLRQPSMRLLTLTGPGGTGKTRLALQVAATLLPDFPGGVFFVNLAPLSDPDLVPSAIAGVLDVQEETTRDLVESLVDALQGRRLLLVLDNFEHLLAASSVASTLLDACRDLHILVTSRIPLHLSWEHEHLVPPLSIPDPNHLPEASALFRYEAVALFVARARAAQDRFTLTPENAPAVAQICVRLDGLPLAIELAAARSKLFPPQALLPRLSSRLTLLTGGPMDRPSRQQTLRNTLDWSYSLLTAPEQILFARFGVFVGGCTLGALESVCDPDGILDLLDVIGSLVEKNLVRQQGEDEPRFVMLETIREYAVERLMESREADALRRRHAEHYLALAEQADPELQGAEQRAWLEHLEREHDNLRAALTFTWERHDITLGLRLAGALATFWHRRGHLREGRSWLDRLLAADGRGEASPAARARALAGAAWLAQAQDDFAAANPLLEESIALRRVIGQEEGGTDLLVNSALEARLEGNYARATALLEEALAIQRSRGARGTIGQHGLGLTLFRLGMVVREQGKLEQAAPLYEECLALHREAGDREGVAIALLGLCDIARDQGDSERVALYGRESCALFEELGEPWGAGCCFNNLALGAYGQGLFDDAERYAARSVAVFRDISLVPSMSESLATLGRIALDRGDIARANETLRESLAVAFGKGPRYIVPSALEGLADVALREGRATFAVRLLATASALRAQLGTPIPAFFRVAVERTLARLRQVLDGETFAGAWEEGPRQPLDQTVAEALGHTGSTSTR